MDDYVSAENLNDRRSRVKLELRFHLKIRAKTSQLALLQLTTDRTE